MAGHLPADVQGVLLPAVLLGEDHQVGVLPGHLPQVPPPVQGLPAGTAEQADDPPAGVLLPGGAEQGLEGHAVVGVVHDGGDRLVGVGVHLHPAGHPGLHQAHVDAPLGDGQGLAHADGGQGVFHVEQPGHGQPELPEIPPGAHPEEDVAPPLAHLGGVHVGLLVLPGEGEHRLSGGLCRLQDPVGVVAVQVDAVHRPLLEDAQLGGEVVLEVRVLDGGDVVLADVQEAGGGEVGTQGPVVLQRLAGHLHGQILQAVVQGVGEVPLELQGLGSGQVGLEPLPPVVGVDGRDDAAVRLALLGHILVQDIFQVVGGGALPLGPRQADDLQLPGGVVVEQVGQRGDGLPHVGYLDTGQACLGIGGLAHIGEGPLLPGRLQELRPEMGPLAQEQGAGDHRPGVVGHQGHRGGPVQVRRDRSGQQPPLLQTGQVGLNGFG